MRLQIRWDNGNVYIMSTVLIQAYNAKVNCLTVFTRRVYEGVAYLQNLLTFLKMFYTAIDITTTNYTRHYSCSGGLDL
jgi:hypothetical protein